MKYIKMTLLSGVVGVLAACNGAPDGASSTDYTQPLAGGASLSITIPNDISSNSNTTINVANRPSGAVYTFAFPTPVPVINKSKTTSSNLQADGNLSVTTSPTPCIIDDIHPSCQLVFNPTGAVNGTYQITPHYAAAGTVTKADTALNSFNVSVSGQPVQELAPFLVQTFIDNGDNDYSNGALYAYKNGSLQSVMPALQESEDSMTFFANINNNPIYLMEIWSNEQSSNIMSITSFKYSTNGYTWQNGNMFSCASGEIAYDSEYDSGYTSQTPNAIIRECFNEDIDGVTALYSNVNGKDWNLVWQGSAVNFLPRGVHLAIYKLGEYYFASSLVNNSIVLYKLVNNSWINQNMDTSSMGNCQYTLTTNGNNFILTCDHTAYVSNDLGKTWSAVYPDPNNGISYDSYLNQYYETSGLFYSNSGERNTWVQTTPNMDNLIIWGYNPQVGYISSGIPPIGNGVDDKIYFAPNIQNGQLNFQQKIDVRTMTSNPNLRIANLVVGY